MPAQVQLHIVDKTVLADILSVRSGVVILLV